MVGRRRPAEDGGARLCDRRTVLRAGAVVLTGANAGCLDWAGDDEATPVDSRGGNATDASTTSPTPNDEPLEVIHGWTGGSSMDAMESLQEVFGESHPETPTDVHVWNTGHSCNSQCVIRRRLEDRNPPSSFATSPGANLLKHAWAYDDCESDVWERGGLKRAHPAEIREACRLNDRWVAVPVSSLRVNNLFYNVDVVESAGVDPGGIDDVAALREALDAVATETDAVPFAHAMLYPWTNLQLFASALLGEEKAQGYAAFTGGATDIRAPVRRTLRSLKPILETHVPDDADRLDQRRAAQTIVDGEAAFVHQGSWVLPAFRDAADFEFGADWDWVPFPGTDGSFLTYLDAFTNPRDDPTPRKTPTWLQFVGSAAGQQAFTGPRGSVPTHTGADVSDFHPFQRAMYEDFLSADQRPPSLTHGLAVRDDTLQSLNQVIQDRFTGPFDVDAAAEGLVAAVQ